MPNINALLTSYFGMYAVQVLVHSLIASLIVDIALLVWKITKPVNQQAFRLIVLFLPFMMYPIYQFINPDRGSLFFRLHSLTDINKWLFTEIVGLPMYFLLLAVCVLTSVVFIIQEFLPMVMQFLYQRSRSAQDALQEEDVLPEEFVERLEEALEGLPFHIDDIKIINNDDLELFSSTGLRPKIYATTGIIDAFDREHLRAALAHEIGHIVRSRKPILMVAYVVRCIMFFNPIALIEFRKIAQEEEKICDDIAIELTNNPEALYDAIAMMRPEYEAYEEGGIKGVASSLEHYSHEVMLKNRLMRIGGQSYERSDSAIAFSFTVLLIAGLNYFIV